MAAHQLLAPERMRGELDALDGQSGAELVHGPVLGHDLVPELHLKRSARDARVVLLVAGLGRGAGVAHLPVQRHAVRGVLGQQLVQDRGPGARQPGDEDGRRHGLARDLGPALAPVGELEPVLEPVHDVAARDQAPERVQLRLRVEGAHEDTVGLEEVVAAEVREAALRARLGEQLVGVEPDPGRVGDRV
jgi:hypothetical protein